MLSHFLEDFFPFIPATRRVMVWSVSPALLLSILRAPGGRVTPRRLHKCYGGGSEREEKPSLVWGREKRPE